MNARAKHADTAHRLGKQFGIEGQISAKLTRLAPGLSVGETLARKEAELGFTQVSELLHIKGIDYLGPLGPEVQCNGLRVWLPEQRAGECRGSTTDRALDVQRFQGSSASARP